MNISISQTTTELGQVSGKQASTKIKEAIHQQGFANIILATGSSQFETLNYLVNDNTIQWDKVTMFHLDEYIGLPISHKASFRKYLKERFLNHLQLNAYHLIDGENKPEDEIQRLNEIIEQHPIDVAMVGIGENGHLAFNDPPANFETESPYIVVALDQACRQQQVNEGWFETLADVPEKAISISIRHIMKSKHIICSVPDERKALAVKNTVQNEVSPLFPASILQQHPNCELFLDIHSASLL